MAKAPALGKGLKALIGNTPAGIIAPQPGERILSLPLGKIIPSPLQPRTDFRNDQLAELIESIRERGIIQPLIVRKVNDQFELIAGERRWRAAHEVGLADAPAIVREADDREVLELALVENLQREDLNPIEEAQAYAKLSREFSMTQEQIAKRVGKNRATVANAMRLLDLHEEIQGFVRVGTLTVGHAKALLSIKNKEEQKQIAQLLIKQGSPVRAAEQIVARHLRNDASGGTHSTGTAGNQRGKQASRHSPAIQRMENLLQERLATRVQLKHGEKSGTIHIEYYGNDDLDRILSLLGVETLE